MSSKLDTVAGVIDALGGTRQTADLTGRSIEAVGMWRVREKFPPDTYVLLTGLLKRRRLSAHTALWGMTSAGSSESVV